MKGVDKYVGQDSIAGLFWKQNFTTTKEIDILYNHLKSWEDTASRDPSLSKKFTKIYKWIWVVGILLGTS